MNPPYENVSAVGVYWQEAHRIGDLASIIAAWFKNASLVVQKGDDTTLTVLQDYLIRPTHHITEDEWRGGGDFSMPLALSKVATPWSFVISGDELPDLELLRSLPDAIAACEEGGYSGAFIKFYETLDGVEFVQHEEGHVRLFRTAGGWEARHHSAASHENLLPYTWPTGKIIHARSLEEMCRDYLRKLTMMEAEGDEKLALHNRYAIFTACNLVAGVHGWRHVWSLPMWDEIERRVFAYAETPMEVI